MTLTGNGRRLALAAAAMVAGAGALAYTGHLPVLKTPTLPAADSANLAPAVTVMRVVPADFVETIQLTGTLVAREEILVGPEVEGLRIIEVLADEGDRVKKGQVLARLVSDTLEAQLAQNAAVLARTEAAIAQAQSNIVAASAKLTEAQNAFNRGKPLRQSGYISEALQDQREATAKTADAQLASARDGLKVAQAEKAQIEAQRREISWRLGRTEIAAPADGLVSRRVARIGGFAAGNGDAMFRIVARGEIELEAEVPEMRVVRVKEGQSVIVHVADGLDVTGKVRLVSPEIDRQTRLGRIRVFLGDGPGLRIGAFARGTLQGASSRGLAVASSAVQFADAIATVQVVVNATVETRTVKLGLVSGGFTEVAAGLAEGDMIVVKAGTFLRNGDAVRPVLDTTKLSEAAR